MESIDLIDLVEVGRRLGDDFYRLSRQPCHDSWPSAVREGFAAAHARHGGRQHGDDRFTQKWLQLRLGALARGRAVAPDVTVDLLRRLDISHCPVTRQPLTHRTRQGTDASVDRLNNDGAYAASNLAMLSSYVNRAKGTRTFDEVWALSQRTRSESGLQPIEWLRLAALMLGPAHAARPLDVPALPLCAPLPPTSVRTALQQVQRLLTLNCGVAASRNRLLRGLVPACTGTSSETRLRLLADAVHHGLKRLTPEEECWDVWLQPGLMEALAAWREDFDRNAWARLSWTAGQLAGGHPVNRQELDPWRLATRGYVASTICKKCPEKSTCGADSDCVTNICTAGTCNGCHNNKKDGKESDLDCGGPDCDPCPDTKNCMAATDCASKGCLNGKCSMCADGMQNNGETDIDCGGANCPKCDNGKVCAMTSDCANGICEGFKCGSCADGMKNGTESDVDCGGACPTKCPETKACTDNADCFYKICELPAPPDGGPQEPGTCNTCHTGVKDGAETDMDCGGPTCPKCVKTKMCKINLDCTSGICIGSVCQ